MKLPSKIKIGGHNYKIRYPYIFDKDNLTGQCAFRRYLPGFNGQSRAKGDNMSCRKELSNACCCTCEYQLEIHVCSCGQCSTVTGYVCIMFHVQDHSYLCSYKTSKHGLCEIFTQRKGAIKKSGIVRRLNKKLNQEAGNTPY